MTEGRQYATGAAMNTYRRFARCVIHGVAVVACWLSAVSRADDPTISFHFINVGQAASTLIEAKCGLVLIDAAAHEADG